MVSPRFPCTVPVEVLYWREGGRDPYSNPVRRWETSQVLVFGVQVGGSAAATATNPEGTEFDAVVYAPAAAGVSVGDRVRYMGETYDVVEPPGNWDANPWFAPGLVECRCKKTKG